MVSASAISTASIFRSSSRQEVLRRRVSPGQRRGCRRQLVVRASAKDIAFDQSSGTSLQAGVEKLANAVGSTSALELVSKTNDSAGTGTATASVIAQEIIKLGLLSVTSGANPVSIKKGIDKTIQGLVEELEKKARQLRDVVTTNVS